ncbi:MAG: hypothetical protein ACK40O_01005 [Allosphingosinicella sp.]
MTAERYPPARLTPAQLLDLPEYSTTIPTGTTPGKRWRRALRPWRSGLSDEWWLGQYGKPYPEGHEHFGSVAIFWRRIIVIGAPARWPADVRVDTPRKPNPPAAAGIPWSARRGRGEAIEPSGRTKVASPLSTSGGAAK